MKKVYYKNGKRYAVCIGCGEEWNIAKGQRVHRDGYICPHCRGKIKKEIKEDEG